MSMMNRAGAALFLLAVTALPSPLPSGFFEHIGQRPCHGVITKIDLPGANIIKAELELERLGLKRPFFQSSLYNIEKLELLRTLTSPRHKAADTEERHVT